MRFLTGEEVKELIGQNQGCEEKKVDKFFRGNWGYLLSRFQAANVARKRAIKECWKVATVKAVAQGIKKACS